MNPRDRSLIGFALAGILCVLCGCANLTYDPKSSPAPSSSAPSVPARYTPLDNPDNHKSYEATPR